jgi:hypothetical protein
MGYHKRVGVLSNLTQSVSPAPRQGELLPMTKLTSSPDSAQHVWGCRLADRHVSARIGSPEGRRTTEFLLSIRKLTKSCIKAKDFSGGVCQLVAQIQTSRSHRRFHHGMWGRHINLCYEPFCAESGVHGYDATLELMNRARGVGLSRGASCSCHSTINIWTGRLPQCARSALSARGNPHP